MGYDREGYRNPLRVLKTRVHRNRKIPRDIRTHINGLIEEHLALHLTRAQQVSVSTALNARLEVLRIEQRLSELTPSNRDYLHAMNAYHKAAYISRVWLQLGKEQKSGGNGRMKPPTRQSEPSIHTDPEEAA